MTYDDGQSGSGTARMPLARITTGIPGLDELIEGGFPFPG